MRLVMFGSGGEFAAGVQLVSGQIAPARALLGERAPATVAGLIAGGAGLLGELRESAATVSASLLVPEDQVRLGAPVGERELIVCAGANYLSHVREMGDELPEKPAWFIKNSRCVTGPGRSIILPAEYPGMVDYEGELCVVIGRPCFAVRAADAWDYVAGYTLLNDVSARDELSGLARASTPLEGRWAWTDMLLGKQFPTFGPVGPAVVTADEIGDPAAVRLTTTVNGVKMQDAPLSDLAFGIPELIETFSRYFPFQPGDVISTGSPAGVGAGRTPPSYLRPGDVVTVAATGIGELTNTVGH